MKKFLLCGLLLASTAALAETYTFQTLAGKADSGVTSTQQGVYIVSKDFTVAAGDTLVLENRATVRLEKDVMIYVEGYANLAPADTATITTDLENPGKGFQFTGDVTTPSLIQNITFEGTGVRYVRDGALTVKNCSFLKTTGNINSGASALAFVHSNGGNVVSGCNFIDCYGAAIAGGANILTGITIENCYLNNCVTSNTNRPFLNLTVGGDNPVIVKGNRIIGAKLNMPGAITVANLLSMQGQNLAIIENNYAENCRYGINIMGNATAKIINNTLIDNHYELNANNGGSGVTAYMSTIYLEGNHIEGSLWGVTVVNGNANLGKIADPNAADYNPGNNVFKNNGNCGTAPEGTNSAYDPTKPYDLYNNSKNEIYAQNNTWSVAEQTEELIETVIFHFNDNANLGKVIFMPAKSNDSVDSLQSDAEIISTEWYDINGAKVASPEEGNLYIRIDRLSNGAIKTEKTIK